MTSMKYDFAEVGILLSAIIIVENIYNGRRLKRQNNNKRDRKAFLYYKCMKTHKILISYQVIENDLISEVFVTFFQ